MDSRFMSAVATLVGATIGAGVLGIPYVVYKAGFWTGMLVILGVGAATLLINLYLAEVALRTKGTHQLTGYVEKYLGKKAKAIAAFFMITGLYGALLAYTIGVGNSAAAILGGSSILYSLAFFAAASIIVRKGIKSIGVAELLVTGLMIGVVILIPILSAGYLQQSNLQGLDLGKLMVPFGVVLFAFMGAPAIPEMKEQLSNNRKMLKKAVIIGTLIPLFVYLLFAAVVVALVGPGFETLAADSRIATVAVKDFVRPEVAVLANLFGILTMSTSFMALSYAQWSTLQHDHNIKKAKALILTLSVPLLIFMVDAVLSDITNFISVIGIIGSITGGVIGILIVMSHWKAARKSQLKPEFRLKPSIAAAAALVIMFAIGIIHELSRELQRLL